jgi:hypothetical protein
MLFTRSRSIFLIGFLAVCAIGLYLSFTKSQNTLGSNSNTLESDVISYSGGTAKNSSEKQNVNIHQKVSTQGPNKQSNPIVEQYRTMMGNPVEMAEVKEWFNRMGYPAFDTNEYSSYDQKALEKLAKNGDVRAINLLAQMIYGTEGFDASKSLYLEGAARGSTDSINSIALITYIERLRGVTDDIQRQSVVVDLLAWSKVGKLRGDEFSYLNGGRSYIQDYVISEEQEANSDKLAQQYYQQLQIKRDELGLGAFDNSVPESVKNFFDQLKLSQQ